MYYYCTDYSDAGAEDWSSGTNTVTNDFQGTGPFIIGTLEDVHTIATNRVQWRTQNAFVAGAPVSEYTGQDWIDYLNEGGGGWAVKASINLTVRHDTGHINTSPVTATTPVVRLKYGCTGVITIPVNDADGDTVRCRWAESKWSECGGVCRAFSSAELNQDTCTLAVRNTTTAGWYAVALMIEDFARVGDVTPLSSIPLQFLVVVMVTTQNCTSNPEYTYYTVADGSCLGVPLDQTYTERIVARIPHANVSQTATKTVSPQGLITSQSPRLLPGSPNEYYVNITWQPLASQTGPHIFCFSSLFGATSTAQRCVTFLVGVTPPSAVAYYPQGEILPTHSRWTIKYPSLFAKQSASRFAYFFEDGVRDYVLRADVTSPGVVITTDSVTFNIGYRFKEKTVYYVFLDHGIVKGTTMCGAESGRLWDPAVWRVTIKDVTPPVTTITTTTTRTRANITIEWTIDEDATSVCTLHTPTAQSSFGCQSPQSFTDLTQGTYFLYVTSTDTANNTGQVVHQSWTVDTTPPTVVFGSVPPKLSNLATFTFMSYCDEVCTFECSLYMVPRPDPIVWTPCTRWHQVSMDSSSADYRYSVRATDDVGNVGDVSSYDFVIDRIPPVIAKVANASILCGSPTDSSITGTPVATDNIAVAKLTHKDEDVSGCFIAREWIATDTAGNTAQRVQYINILSPSGPTVTMEQSVVVPCDSQASMTTSEYLEQTIQVTHPCHLSTRLTYTDSVPQLSCSMSFRRTWTVSDKCGVSVTVHQKVRVLEPRHPKYPQNGQVNVRRDTHLQWFPYFGVTGYSVYLWQHGTARPQDALVDTSNTYHYLDNNLNTGTKYLWQVMFHKSPNTSVPSPVWGFETRRYPDFQLFNIDLPPFAYSGEPVSISWTVKNIGDAASDQRYWYDVVYLSPSPQLDSTSRVLGDRIINNVILPNDAYTEQSQFLLRDDEVGLYYIYMRTDRYNSLNDIDRSNNILRSSGALNVRLTPPPDLQVQSVIYPSPSFSGTNVIVKWSVKNFGSGRTKATTWTDALYWSHDEQLDSSDPLLATVRHTGILQPSEPYTQTHSVSIPRKIFGNYSIIVQTDYYGQVYEHNRGDNNVKAGRTMVVTLTPPPDLAVTNVTHPNELTTGDTLTVSWTVSNEGSTAPYTTYWRDSVTLVNKLTSVITDIGTSTYSGQFYPGDMYMRSLSRLINSHFSDGIYQLRVQADAYNNVFEHTYKSNNLFVSDIKIQQQLPDLEIHELSATVAIKERIAVLSVQWKVRNIAKGPLLASSWSDHVFVLLDKGQETYVASRLVYTSEGNRYSRKIDVELSEKIFGRIRVKVSVDHTVRTADSNRRNNQKTSAILDVPPVTVDLSILAFTRLGTETVYSGDTVNVTWTVTNTGNRDLKGKNWIDAVFLSNTIAGDSVLEKLAEVSMNQNVASGDNYTTLVSVLIPESVAGLLYIKLVINEGGRVFENGATDDNIMLKEVKVATPPSSDLSMGEVSATGNDKLGAVTVKWSVSNNGNSMRRTYQWIDCVQISEDVGYAEVTALDDPLGTYPVAMKLSTKQTYHSEHVLVVPDALMNKYFTILVMTDCFNALSEVNGEFNNIARSWRVMVKKESAKLTTKIRSISPLSPTMGDDVEVKYQVTNTGEKGTDAQTWTDTIYWCTANPKTQEDITQYCKKVADNQRNGQLKKDQSYEVTVNGTMPFVDTTKNGNFHVVTDSRNVMSAPKDVVYNTTVHVTLVEGKRSDLTPSVAGAILTGRGGEPINVRYNVSNIGSANVRRYWFDSIVLSLDIISDPFDSKLGTFRRTDKLKPNETMTYNVSAFVPYDLLSGVYYVILTVNSRNDAMEENEYNNQAFQEIHLAEVSSTDIVVKQVTAPPTVNVLDRHDFSWTLGNNGSLEASGYRCDSLYLSKNNKWDISDVRLDVPDCSYFTLHSQGDVSFSRNVQVPFLGQGNYTALVKSRTNVVDINLDNNVGFSIVQTEVSVPILKMDTPTNIDMAIGTQMAYRMVGVPSEETLIIKLTSTSINDINNMYVKYGRGARKFDFDNAADNENQASIRVVVPVTRGGEYYLLVERTGSLATGVSTSSTLTVHAKIAVFEISDVSPRTAAPLGNVTLRIEGAKFPQSMKASLVIPRSGRIPAVRTIRMSPVLAFATFDIREMAIGSTHGIVLEDNQSSDVTNTFPNALKISRGVRGKAFLKVENPRPMRVGEIGVMGFIVENTGDTDINVPLIYINSTASVKVIKKHDDGLTNDYVNALTLIATPDEGPGGVLPPRSKSHVKLLVKRDEFGRGVDNVQFTEIHPDFDDNRYNQDIDWKPLQRYMDYSDGVWNSLWSRFLKIVGKSDNSLSNVVSILLDRLSSFNRRVYTLEDVESHFLNSADGAFSIRPLASAKDLTYLSDQSTLLPIIGRYYSTRIGMRDMVGAFGKGWISPLWDSKISESDKEYMILSHERHLHIFTLDDRGVFVHPKFGAASVTQDDVSVTIGGRVHTYDTVYGRLIRITDQRSHNVYNLTYSSGDKAQIRTVRGNGSLYYAMLYDDMKRVKTISLHEYNQVLEASQFEYDDDLNVLISVKTGNKMTKYTYNDNSYLTETTYATQAKEHFTYNSNHLLETRRVVMGNSEILSNEYYDYEIGGFVVSDNVTGLTFRYTYDENSNMLAIQRGDGLKLVSNNYGFVSENTFGDLTVTRGVYNRASKIMTISDANGDKIKFMYDDNQHLTNFVDSEGYEMRVENNAKGLPIKATYPDGLTASFTYNSNGQYTSIVTRGGTTKRYEYDDSRNLIQEAIEDGVTTNFAYNDKNQMIQASVSDQVTDLIYDNDQIDEVVYPDKKFVKYTYNDVRQVTSIKASDNYDVKYVYDARKRLSQVTSNSDTLLDISYDKFDRIVRKTLGNGAYTDYLYHQASGAIQSVVNRYSDGNVASKYEFEYNLYNRRVKMTTLDGDWTYRYDPSGQLTYVKQPDGTETTYTYDNRRNRVAVSVGDTTHIYATNSMNQYERYGSDVFTYDDDGNLVEKRGSSHVTLQYDGNNRLVGASNGTGGCVYGYSSLGHLYSSQCGDVRTRFLMDPFAQFGDQLIAEYTDNNAPTQYYSAPNMGLVAMKQKGDVFYYQFDPIGSVVAILDSQQSIVNSYVYEPFGRIMKSSETLPNRFKFVGQLGILALGVSDAKTGDLYYMRTRMYDSQHGRFVSMDPIGLRGDTKNLYVYVDNNPVMLVDPHGTYIPVLLFAGKAALGVGIYMATNYITGEKNTWGGALGAGAAALVTVPGAGAIRNVLSAVASNTLGYLIEIKVDGKAFSPIDIVAGTLGSLGAGKLVKHGGKAIGRLWNKRGIFTKHLGNTVKRFWNKHGEKIEKAITMVAKQLGDAVTGKYTTKKIKKALEMSWNLTRNAWNAIDWDRSWNYTRNVVEGVGDWLTSIDPNDIIGPAGYGLGHFIQKDLLLEYTIRFENDANATAPAQRVFISTDLDDDLDARSFRVGSFGFGNFTFDVEKPTSFLQESLDFTSTLGVYVRVVAGIDVVSHEATWTLQTLDPLTGEQPDDPTIGFLPPNNGTTGQGYVTYSVKVKRTTPSMARIDALAAIVFDLNDPIDTPPIFNTIDDTIPTTVLSSPNATLRSQVIGLTVDNTDVGAGVKSVDILLVNDSSIEVLVPDVTSAFVLLPLASGRTYTLAAQPVDHVGNRRLVEHITDDDLIQVFFPKLNVTCEKMSGCSHHGVCVGQDLCACHRGFYGSDCSKDTPPLEPPVVTTYQPPHHDHTHFLDIAVSSINNQTYDSVHINISNLPSVFVHSDISDGILLLTSPDNLVSFTVPLGYSGSSVVDIKVVVTSDSDSASRVFRYTVIIPSIADPPLLSVTPPCYHGDMFIPLHIDASLADSDGSEELTIQITDIPAGVAIDAAVLSNGSDFLRTNETDNINLVYSLGSFSPFRITVVAIATEIVNGDTASNRTSVLVEECVLTTTEGTTSAAPLATEQQLLSLLGYLLVLCVLVRP